MRGATKKSIPYLRSGVISIHAPHAGCDVKDVGGEYNGYYFNPRTPCGVRLFTAKRCTESERRFQSTHPMRGATDETLVDVHVEFEFQSTHPMRGATAFSPYNINIKGISIHAPHAGCDDVKQGSRYNIRISIHAPHAGCDKVQYTIVI